MANNNSFLAFLAGAVAGAAVTAFLKSDREKINTILDSIEEKLGGRMPEKSPETETEAEETEQEEQA